MKPFLTAKDLVQGSWQSFERSVCRLLVCEGFDNVRLVGGTGDKGADVLASRFGKRFVFQIKHWNKPVGLSVIDEVLSARRFYDADIPVIVSLRGFQSPVHEKQRHLMADRISLQLLDANDLERRAGKIPEVPPLRPARPYQEPIIDAVVRSWLENKNRGMVVMATGLGKTFTAGESIRRINANKRVRTLVLAHTNELVYQLEKSFWPFLKNNQSTVVWNGLESPSQESFENSDFIFACQRTVAEHIRNGKEVADFDVVLVDECHHVGGSMYLEIIENLRAGKPGGPYLLGLTATPWRPDDIDLEDYFGAPLASLDLVKGLKMGFLSNVDYRMHTDNIDWENLVKIQGAKFSPKYINRTLFIKEWNDAVVDELRAVWEEIPNPRAIVFCGTIDHAIVMRDKINALGFCRAEALYSSAPGVTKISNAERNKVMCDFQDGNIQIVCSVDILNEGVDVPDVNLIVFQRVTHSRRIFIQQLGRGLRLSEGKEKVVVLDFVSDIRRFAAGLNLKNQLSQTESHKPINVRINNKVSFKRVGSEDPNTETFLKEWLEDVAAVENADEDASVLKFPPKKIEGKT